MIHWRDSYDAALREAAQGSKLVLFDIFNPG
jgi:hypothetical protein